MANERRPFHSDRPRDSRNNHFSDKRDRRNNNDVIMYDAECEKCHAAFQVPFQPEPGRTLLCRDCLKEARNNGEMNSSRRDRSDDGERAFSWDRGGNDRSERREHRDFDRHARSDSDRNSHAERSDRSYEHRHNREQHEKVQYEIVCSHCGKTDTVPFKPYEDSVVLCRECKKNPNVSRVGGKIMHTIICAVCGKENQVPFRPDPGSRVLCRECHLKEREEKQRSREYYNRHHPAIVNNTKVRVEIKCERCGCDDVLPYLPKTHGAILCRQCAEQTFGDDWAKRHHIGAKEFPITCARCGAQEFVPFKPQEDREYLCKHCLNDEAILRRPEGKTTRTSKGACIRHAKKED